MQCIEFLCTPGSGVSPRWVAAAAGNSAKLGDLGFESRLGLLLFISRATTGEELPGLYGSLTHLAHTQATPL